MVRWKRNQTRRKKIKDESEKNTRRQKKKRTDKEKIWWNRNGENWSGIQGGICEKRRKKNGKKKEKIEKKRRNNKEVEGIKRVVNWEKRKWQRPIGNISRTKSKI